MSSETTPTSEAKVPSGHKVIALLKRHKRRLIWLVTAGILVPIVIVAGCFAWIQPYDKYVLPAKDVAAIRDKHIRVGIVMGAGITSKGKPYRELQARLDVAAQAVQNNEVQKLILTGDNSRKSYDEPTAMRNYLVNVKHIAAWRLQPDYAGRDTYASCQRASQIFSLKQAIIFSAGTHLPRAIFLCRSFGIETYGVASGVEANNAHRREIMARVKAILNVYILPEHTILGPRIKV